MRKFAYLCALLLFIFLSATAGATGVIRGYVTDKDSGLPIKGANISILGTNRGTATGHDGKFLIDNITSGKYTITCSHIGYDRAQISFIIEAGDTMWVEFYVASGSLEVPVVEIVGERIEQIERIPGSAVVVPEYFLNQSNPSNANDVFRRIPGINVRDEEGQGLRPNIGIRGIDPTRSRKVLILEDGVPIALAPYGEPEMYYNPPIERMRRIEILKGSGSILFGPQTVGGVINYITRHPPLNPTLTARVTGGNNRYFSGLLSYGGTWGDAGINLIYLRKSGSGFRDHSSFTVNDIVSQFALGLTESSRLGIKVNLYDETSNSTYLGLTQSMYETDPHQNPAKHDVMDVKRYSASVTHQQILGDHGIITTTVYANHTVRNWRRQDYDRFNAGRDYERVAGDTSIPGGAVYLRRSTGNRNREFRVYGVEPRLQVSHRTAGIPGEIDLGLRMHFEKMNILRINGSTPTSLSGNIAEDEVRQTGALAAFIKNRSQIVSPLNITTGLRVEAYEFLRTSRRDIINGEPVDIERKGRSGSVELIPGIGFTYKPFGFLTLFSGLHRGFSPQRVQDAIDSEGKDLELEAEFSWNYEFGLRANPLDGVESEITIYYLDFRNQIIPASEAGGIDTRLINAGKTVHKGVELSAITDIGIILGRKFNLILEGTISLSDAVFASGIFKGKQLPHAPAETYTLGLNYVSPGGLDINLTSVFLSEQFTDRANTREGSADGEVGIIPPYSIWNLTLNYHFSNYNTQVFLGVTNLFDKVYIASRSPRGIFPGPFRQIKAGLRLTI